MRYLPMLVTLFALTSPLFAHWEVANPTYPWATPGQVRSKFGGTIHNSW